jgi:sarcosine oxidase
MLGSRKVRRTEFVVVGAGLLGLSAAYELGARGRDVICLEQATIGHERSESKSQSRLFRLSHDDPSYARLAIRSLAGWRRLEDQAGQRLLEPTTLLIFGHDLAGYTEAMAAAGRTTSLASRAELSERFDGFNFTRPGAFTGAGQVLVEPDAQVMRAERVLLALATLSRAELREGEQVVRFSEEADHVLVDTPAASYRCDRVLLCPGAWSGRLAAAAGLATTGLQTTLGQVAYLAPRAGGLGPAPAFMELSAPDDAGNPSYAWGVPTPALGYYKIGLHQPRLPVDPAAVSLAPDEAELTGLHRRATSLLPGFDPAPVTTERCFFDSSPDEHPVIDRAGRVVIGAGTSGRGFKFGPAFGQLLADLATDAPLTHWDQRFALSRPALRRAWPG